jgi:hypothetical protein
MKTSVNNTTRFSLFSSLLAHALVLLAEEEEEVEGRIISLPFPPPLSDIIGGYDS